MTLYIEVQSVSVVISRQIKNGTLVYWFRSGRLKCWDVKISVIYCDVFYGNADAMHTDPYVLTSILGHYSGIQGGTVLYIFPSKLHSNTSGRVNVRNRFHINICSKSLRFRIADCQIFLLQEGIFSCCLKIKTPPGYHRQNRRAFSLKKERENVRDDH